MSDPAEPSWAAWRLTRNWLLGDLDRQAHTTCGSQNLQLSLLPFLCGMGCSLSFLPAHELRRIYRYTYSGWEADAVCNCCVAWPVHLDHILTHWPIYLEFGISVGKGTSCLAPPIQSSQYTFNVWLQHVEQSVFIPHPKPLTAAQHKPRSSLAPKLSCTHFLTLYATCTEWLVYTQGVFCRNASFVGLARTVFLHRIWPYRFSLDYKGIQPGMAAQPMRMR